MRIWAFAVNFFPKSNRKCVRELLSQDRSRMSRVVGVDYRTLWAEPTLQQVEATVTPIRSCNEDEKTGIHLVCDCPEFSQLRRRVLGDYSIQPSDAIALKPPLDRFLLATKKLQWCEWWRGKKQGITRSVFQCQRDRPKIITQNNLVSLTSCW